jgi:hypothetical protein
LAALIWLILHLSAALTEKSAFTEKPIVHSNKGSLEGAENVNTLQEGRETEKQEGPSS